MSVVKQKILGCNEPPIGGKVFLIDQGRRRWIKSVDIIESLGFVWPDDISWVSTRELLSIPLGPAVPGPSSSRWKKPKSMQEMRENLLEGMSGKGVEFGAAANPMPVPVGAKIVYADIFVQPVIKKELYDSSNHEYVDVDIVSSFDDMKHIKNNSLDFIIGSHVIEHVRNPIKTLDLAWQKLVNHGRLALIIPKKERTLDASRSTTTLQHVIDDYKAPDRYKDILHIAEFHALAKPIPITELYEKMTKSINEEYHSMHYHVWNEKTFKELLKYVQKNNHPWKISKMVPAIKGKENYEFYVLLEKTE